MNTNKVVVALGLALLFLLLSCSDNPGVRARYQAEKMYFQAEKQTDAASIRPELNTPETAGKLRADYREIIDFCYNSLDSLDSARYAVERSELGEIAFRAATRLSQLYYIQRQSDSAVVVLNRLLNTVELSGLARISGYLNYGRTLQASGNWDSALTVYQYAVDNFYPPLDAEGRIVTNLFDLPGQILGIYNRLGDSLSAVMALDHAEYYYRDLIKDYPNTDLAIASHGNLANLYERTNRWKKAIEELRYVVDSTGAVTPTARRHIADIHARYTGEPDLAITEYKDLLQSLSGPDTLNRPNILYRIGLTYIDMKAGDSARKALVDIKNLYPRFYESNPAVQLAIARSFELQDNWDRAETELKFLLEKFPASEQALSTHLYLADKYAEQGRTTEADRMQERAEATYDRLAASRPGTPSEALALKYKAELYRRRADWPGTVKVLTSIFDKFPYSEVGYQSMVTAAVTTREKLKNPQVADSLIGELKKKLTPVDERPDF